jgi:hypothetical protein
MKGGGPKYDHTTGQYVSSSGTRKTDIYNKAEADMLNFLMQRTNIRSILQYDYTDTNRFYRNYGQVQRIYDVLQSEDKETFIKFLETIVDYRCQDLTSPDVGHTNQLQIMCNVLRTIGVEPKLTRVIYPRIESVPVDIPRNELRQAAAKLAAKQADIAAMKQRMAAAEKKAAEKKNSEVETYGLPQELLDRIMQSHYSAPLDDILQHAAYLYLQESLEDPTLEDPDTIIQHLNAAFHKKGGTRKRRKRSRRFKTARKVKH